jgi:hypothetical protein
MAGLPRSLGVFVICCAAAGLARAQDVAPVYKWVDRDGTVNYGDQPPAGTAAEALPILLRRSSSAPAQARLKAREVTAPDSLLDSSQPADETDAADPTVPADEREKLLAQRQENCQKAKDRMASYEQAKRIYRPGPTGERVYLSSEEIDAERATARVAVAEWCNE